jgi:hypothetical protein
VPLGAAFLLRSLTAERRAGYFVVLTIFISAAVAAVESVLRLVNPPIISLIITVVILRITVQSWRTIAVHEQR